MSKKKTSAHSHAQLAEAVHRLDELEFLCRNRPNETDPTDLFDALGEVYRASRELVQHDVGAGAGRPAV